MTKCKSIVVHVQNGTLENLSQNMHALSVVQGIYQLLCFDFILFVIGSLVRPKVVRSVHYCPQTKKTLVRRYTDLTSLDAFPTSSVYPTKVMHTFH